MDILLDNNLATRHDCQLGNAYNKKVNKDKAYKETLAEWRARHIEELDIDLARLIAIRDTKGEVATKCPSCKHKFTVALNSLGLVKMQIEAIKTIERKLGALAPEKMDKKDTPQKKDTYISPADEKKIEDRLAQTLGDSWTKLSENT